MSTQKRIRPGICSVTLRELGIDEVVAAALAADLEGIEWGGDVHVPPNDGDAIATARRSTESAGLVCASYGSYLNPASTDDEITAGLATAAALGAPNVRVWAGGGEPTLVGDRWEHEDWNQSVDRLGAIASGAADMGLTASLEFHGWTLTHHAGAAAQLLGDVAAPNLFTYFQPNYWDEPVVHDPDAQLNEFGLVTDQLSHLHLYWWPELGARVPLADGAPVLEPLMTAAGQVDNAWPGDRWAFLEFVVDDKPAQVTDDAATLRELLTL